MEVVSCGHGTDPDAQIALDVHQSKITACSIIEQDDGLVQVDKREFGAFKRDRRALAQWAREVAPEVVVMESTGVYWKSPFAALEAVGIVAWVVNARRQSRTRSQGVHRSLVRFACTCAYGGACIRSALYRTGHRAPLD